MQIIIPMSGQGKRFVAAGYTDPKPLIEVDGKPMIYHVMDLFPGETNISCICSSDHLATTRMREILETYPSAKPTIYSIASHSQGPVYAVQQIENTIDDEQEVIISYCDYGTVWDYKGFLASMRETAADGGITVYRGFHPHMLGTDNYAFLRMRDDGTLAEIREKQPFTDNRMNEFASNGTYYFRTGKILKDAIADLMSKGDAGKVNGEYYVSLLFNCLVQKGLRVHAFEIQKMLQWGTPKDLETYKMWSRHFQRAAKGETAGGSSKATLLLPMAGRGSRFMMKGYTDPKPLLDVNGKHMILRAVESIPSCSDHVFICLQEHLDTYSVEQALRSQYPDAKIITLENTTEGQACTCEIGIREACISADKPILISACDNGVDYNAEAYQILESDPTVDVIVWSFTNNPTSKLFPHMYAWLDVNESNGSIRHVSVKKPLDGAKHCIIGTMYFRRADIFLEGYQDILQKNIRTNGEYYVDDLLNPLIQKGYTVKVFEVDAYICWGTPADYETYIYWLEHFSKVWGSPKSS